MKPFILTLFFCTCTLTAAANVSSEVTFIKANEPDTNAVTVANADLPSSGEHVNRDYQPKAGDFGIGFDSTPFLNYIGNMFNDTQNNTLNLADNTFYLRYFLTDNSAVRLTFNLFTERAVDIFYLDDQAAQVTDPLSRAQVEDRRVTYTNQYQLAAGYMMFRGQNRLRGFFGADLIFGYEDTYRDFDYGNQMTPANAEPLTVVNWNTGNTAPQDVRLLKQAEGSALTLGLGALVGAEYYILPMFALGVEMGLVYGHTFNLQANVSREKMVGSQRVEENIEISPEFSEWVAFSTLPYTFGSLYLMVHF